MPEDLKLSQIGSSQLPPPFRGLHSPGVRKHCQIIFACYFRKSLLPCSAESQGQCPLHCCWGTTWSEISPTFAAQLHLPAHDLFWANLRVQLHLPPLDLKWVCRYLNTVYMNTWFACPLLRNQLVWPSVVSKLFRQTQVPICFGSLVSLKRVQYVNGHIVLCRPPPPPPPPHTPPS